MKIAIHNENKLYLPFKTTPRGPEQCSLRRVFGTIGGFHCHAIKNKIANHSIEKVQNLGNKRRQMCKRPRQESGLCDISYARYSEKRFTQTYNFMETPCFCPFEGHKYGRRKPTETSVFEFSYLCVNSSLEKLRKD